MDSTLAWDPAIWSFEPGSSLGWVHTEFGEYSRTGDHAECPMCGTNQDPRMKGGLKIDFLRDLAVSETASNRPSEVYSMLYHLLGGWQGPVTSNIAQMVLTIKSIRLGRQGGNITFFMIKSFS